MVRKVSSTHDVPRAVREQMSARRHVRSTAIPHAIQRLRWAWPLAWARLRKDEPNTISARSYSPAHWPPIGTSTRSVLPQPRLLRCHAMGRDRRTTPLATKRANPMAFLESEVHGALAAARQALAGLLSCDADDLALIEHARGQHRAAPLRFGRATRCSCPTTPPELPEHHRLRRRPLGRDRGPVNLPFPIDGPRS